MQVRAPRHLPARRQRGAAALAVSLLLLFGMTALAFFANRNMIFEQRTSANQFRSTKAFEVAEAGLEWAVARLNEERNLATAPGCATSDTGTQSYAERYLPMTNAGFTSYDASVAAQRRRSACRISAAGAVTCDCPVIGTAPSLSSNDDPRFLVEFLNGPSPWAVRIQVVGCTDDAAACGGSGSADGTAVVSALYMMKPAQASKPGAGLISGSTTNVSGNLTVINKDPTSNGITIHSGSVVNMSPAAGVSIEVYTLDGTPPAASVLDNDFALRNLTNALDASGGTSGEPFFRSFFNQGFEDYKTSSKTWVVTSGSCAAYGDRCTPSCGDATACGQAITNAYAKGFERFYADTNIDLSNTNGGTFGSSTRPLSVVSTGNLGFSGTVTAYGMFYAATGDANANYTIPGVGNATVYGAIISRAQFLKGSGTLKLIYDPNIFNPAAQRGLMVRVPGSWRDSRGEL